MNRAGQRLLMVDQSLKGPGGHHFDYVLQTLKAAALQQRPISLATHRRFRATDALLNSLEPLVDRSTAESGGQSHPTSTSVELQVAPLFHLTTYSFWSDLDGLRRMTPQRLPLSQRIKDFLRHREARLLSIADPPSAALCRSATSHLTTMQRLVVTIFCRDLVQYLKQVQPVKGDSLFFTTVSELEFLAMGIVARSHPDLTACQWHIQFHFDLFSGRPHEYASQANRPETTRALQSLQRGRDGLEGRSVHLYTTSQTLADQYNGLQIGRFEPLPYPINPRFTAATSSPDSDAPKGPLRVTLAGGQRHEKGQPQLQQVIDDLADPVLLSGKAKMVVQRSRRSKWRHSLLDLTLPPTTGGEPAAATPAWLEYVDHPLSEQDYVQLIRTADIGLMLYDSRTYYARRAGVLGEFLACGVPVIVPSACWLADQVESANRRYWKHLFESGTMLDVFRQDRSKTPVLDVTARSDWSAVVCRFSISRTDSEQHHVTVGWQPLSGEVRGASGSLNRWPTTLDCEGEAWCLLPVFPSSQSVPYRLSLRWTFSDEPVSLREFELRSIEVSGHDEVPWGDIGLVADDADQVAALLGHLCRQYPQFRDAARRHSRSWFERHDPVKTVDRLLRGVTSSQTAPADRRAA